MLVLSDDLIEKVTPLYYDCPHCGFEEAVYADEPNVGEYWWACAVCGLDVPLRSRLREEASVEELESRDVPGFDDYVAGVDGFVYRRAGRDIRRLSGVESGAGYLTVWLYGPEGRKTWGVHQVVCRAWHGEPSMDDPQVRHLNGDRLDNRPENLAWGSRSDNMQDALKEGAFAVGERAKSSKLKEGDVRKIRASDESTRALADRFGVSLNTVRDVRAGRTWKHVE